MQFKRAWDQSGVFEDTALRIMPKFMKDESAFSVTVRMTPQGDDRTIHELHKAEEEQLSTYMEAVTF